MNDIGAEGKFSYTDGTAVDFTYWGSGQPDNYGGDEDCVHIRSDNKMNDVQCITKMGFICKK